MCLLVFWKISDTWRGMSSRENQRTYNQKLLIKQGIRGAMSSRDIFFGILWLIVWKYKQSEYISAASPCATLLCTFAASMSTRSVFLLRCPLVHRFFIISLHHCSHSHPIYCPTAFCVTYCGFFLLWNKWLPLQFFSLSVFTTTNCQTLWTFPLSSPHHSLDFSLLFFYTVSPTHLYLNLQM